MASPLTDRALVFAGFMGAGKTVAARAVAAAWGVEPIDTDALLERELGVRIPDFFAEQGEEAFRLREEVCRDPVGSPGLGRVRTGGVRWRSECDCA